MTARLAAFAALLLALLCVVSLTARAQAPVLPAPQQAPLNAAPSSDDLRALITTIENEPQRSEFLKQLKALLEAREAVEKKPAEPEEGRALLTFLSETFAQAGRESAEAVQVLIAAPAALADTFARLRSIDANRVWFRNLGLIAAVFLAGVAAQYASFWLLTRPRHALRGRVPETMGLRAVLLLAHTMLEALPIAAFLATVSIALPAAELPRLPRLGALVLINAHVFTALTLLGLRLILAPEAPNLRILAIEDSRARDGYRWGRRLIMVGIYGYMLASSAVLFGLPRGAERLALALVGLLLLIMAAGLVLRLRRRVAAFLRGPGGAGIWPRLRAIAAASWHAVALAYLIVGYLVWASGIKGSFFAFVQGTASMLAIFAGAALFSAMAKRLLGGALTPSEAARARLAFLEPRMTRARAVTLGAIRVVLFAIAALVTLEAWGVHAIAALRSDLGREAGVSFVTIIGVIFLAFLLWDAAGAAMDHRLETAPPAKRNKLRTIFPLVKRAVLLVLAVMVGFTLLSEFGVNIAPLLAGAGVVGIAVGLGAQSFAKDFLKGISILLEDSIAVGDVVGVGGKTGVVEELSIGSVRLRDYDGTVYVVPFSEVTTVVNMTKDFSYAVLDVAVAYKEDPDRVMEIIAAITEDMRKDEKFAQMILEPVDIGGVDQLGDSGVTIRARIKTRPVTQWGVAREFRRRLKKRFGDLAIEIPHPQRTVHIAGPWPGAAEGTNKKDKT